MATLPKIILDIVRCHDAYDLLDERTKERLIVARSPAPQGQADYVVLGFGTAKSTKRVIELIVEVPFGGDRWHVGVNWAAIGTQSPEDAAAYAEALASVSSLARQLERALGEVTS